MRILLAVIEDLYIFAVSTLFPSWWRNREEGIRLYLPPSRVVSPIREAVGIEALPEEEVIPASETVPVIPKAPPAEPVRPAGFPQKRSVVYCAEPLVSLRSAPDEHSAAIATAAYGDMAMVLETDSGWSYIAVGERRGYVPVRSLAPSAAGVYPAFVIGQENGPYGQNTKKLRAVIRDEFSAGLSQLPLGAHEYVHYRLARRGAQFAWPDIRPRTPGSWAKIFAAVAGAEVKHIPSAGSVMEFTLQSGGKSYLAYVEKVFPDQSIQISEADWPHQGIYNERVLVEEEWKALNPVFITVQ